jgi:hypothetical protein
VREKRVRVKVVGMWVKERGWLTRGTRARQDLVSAAGCQHAGLGGTAPGGVVETRFEPKPKFKRDQIDFKFFQTLTASNRTFLGSENMKQKMVRKNSR